MGGKRKKRKDSDSEEEEEEVGKVTIRDMVSKLKFFFFLSFYCKYLQLLLLFFQISGKRKKNDSPTSEVRLIEDQEYVPFDYVSSNLKMFSGIPLYLYGFLWIRGNKFIFLNSTVKHDTP